jgi:hypothetical protein
MPPEQHVNPAEEPSPAAARFQSQPQVTRIGRRPDNDIVISDLGVSKHHAELRRTPAGRYSITDLGSHGGTYVNGTRVSQQELNEGDVVAIGHATLRLAGGQLIEYADGGADGELLAGMIVTRLQQWLEREGVFEVPGVGRVELAGEIGSEPGSGTLYLRRVDDGRVWRVDVPVAVRPATPEEAKTTLQRARDLVAELRTLLDAREHGIDALQAELRVLAARDPAVLPLLDRLGIKIEQGR